MRRWLLNAAVASVALVAALAACEAMLRLAFPKYGYAADGSAAIDRTRRWSRPTSTWIERVHPDTGRPHPVIYNGSGLHQHREFPPDRLAESTAIAAFGDSFVENVRMPIQYGFTEVLDYLLNTTGRRFEVMSFSNDGYGPDQNWLHYRSSPAAARAKQVIYVFCSNDIRNLYENNLVRLDGEGNLELVPPPESPLLLRALSRLYLTYFAIDARHAIKSWLEPAYRPPAAGTMASLTEKDAAKRKNDEFMSRLWSSPAERIEKAFLAGRYDEIPEWLALFRATLAAWRAEVETNGGRFTVVLLPRDREEAAYALLKDEFEVVSLYQAFVRSIPGYRYEMVKFRKDDHWNELGNMHAAIALFHHLVEPLGLPPLDDGEAAARLALYYKAVGVDGGPDLSLPPVSSDPARLARIRERYLALEAPGAISGR